MYLHLWFLVLSCAHPIFWHEIIIHTILFCLAFIHRRIFLLFILCLNMLFYHTKFPQFNLTHSFVYIRMLSSSVNLLHHICVCLFFELHIFNFQPLFFNTMQKVINQFGWLDDWRGPSNTSMWHSDAHVDVNQLFCHCVFINSDYHK